MSRSDSPINVTKKFLPLTSALILQIKALKKENQSLSESLDSYVSQIEYLNNQINELKKKLDKVTKENQSLSESLDNYVSQIEYLNNQINELMKKLDKADEAIAHYGNQCQLHYNTEIEEREQIELLSAENKQLTARNYYLEKQIEFLNSKISPNKQTPSRISSRKSPRLFHKPPTHNNPNERITNQPRAWR